MTDGYQSKAHKEPLPPDCLEVQADMILWTYLFDSVFYNMLPRGVWNITRREAQVASTKLMRDEIRKADGIVKVHEQELLFIESQRAGDTAHAFSDKIKLAHLLKYATMSLVMNYQNPPEPLSAWGILTSGMMYSP